MKLRLSNLLSLLAVSVMLSHTAYAAGQYPEKPIRIVVGFTAGGPADIIARVMAQKLGESLGQSVIVENVPGAGGNIAAARVAKAAPDGYTLHVISTGFIINPSLYVGGTGYDPLKDFEPIAMLAASPNIISVNSQMKVGSAKELIKLIQTHPNQYNYAHPGIGSTPHLNGELFKLTYKLDGLTTVPFNGTPQLLASAVSGDTPIVFTSLPSALPFIRDGKLKPVMVLSKTRSEILPDVPGTEESGTPGLEGDTVSGILAPAGTPHFIIEKLNAEIRKAAALPDVRAQLLNVGFSVAPSSPAEFRVRIQDEIAKWQHVIRTANIRIQ
ncbi:MAG: tripartite tricarboxylate transporter substrate binding protein [Pigmentiphaga sp.]|uniref:tripartite tricarboxylate transporter substrate binding protein n=1 Tax=Pigmentiphaga sp. TaxID=1977564 RepID=UPI0029A78B0C|nr:tripartite tricarboxylate transporter substrate binding protein [Pigmentiphaga sp.]MDX3906987.1 tripartite tricarboxylate transporter substrate binding protein [Pigmentiphaga sp.]